MDSLAQLRPQLETNEEQSPLPETGVRVEDEQTPENQGRPFVVHDHSLDPSVTETDPRVETRLISNPDAME